MNELSLPPPMRPPAYGIGSYGVAKRSWPVAGSLCVPSVQQPRTPREPDTQATPLNSTSTECVEPVEPVRETSEASGDGHTKGCSGSRMSVTETGEALAGVGAPWVPPTDHMKRQ